MIEPTYPGTPEDSRLNEPTEDAVGKRETRRCALFVDGPNLRHALEKMGHARLDYEKTLRVIGVGRTYVRVMWFDSRLHNHSGSKESQLRCVADAGFTTVVRVCKEVFDPKSGRVRIKGDTDVEMACSIGELPLDEFDDLVLIGGDSDFAGVLKKRAAAGKRVTVISLASMTDISIRNSQDIEFISLSDLLPKIRLTPKHDSRRRSRGRC
jgi:uncharacterized LabA/DUF88 family protein